MEARLTRDELGRIEEVARARVMELLPVLGAGMPKRADPAEPFWMAICVTEDGQPTGSILAMGNLEQAGVYGNAVFAQREDAEFAASRLPPRQEICGVPWDGLRWEVRGVSAVFLQRLQTGEVFRKQRVVMATRTPDGEWNLVPLGEKASLRSRLQSFFRGVA
jgi:hypothetical protein